MKTLLVAGLILGFALSSYAKQKEVVTGQAEILIQPDFGSYFATDLRQVGQKILGNAFWGPIGMINLDMKSDGYVGPAGGNGPTSLKCTDKGCGGFIGGESVDFSSTASLACSQTTYSYRGTVAGNLFNVTRTSNTIQIGGSRGWMDLTKTKTGLYRGRGGFGFGTRSLFAVTLTTTGTLQDLPCPALVAIFLAAPVSQDGIAFR